MPALENVMSVKVTAPSMILIPADLASIAVVRAAVQQALSGAGWDGEDAQRVMLVATEAVANAVEHGSLSGELVEIVYQVTDSEATIRVLDSGHAVRWYPPAGPPAPVPISAPRGRGLSLIHALSQKVEFRPAGRGIELRADFARAR